MKGLLAFALLQPVADGDRFGIAWLDATADTAWQQRVQEELAAATGVDPRSIELDVVTRARRGVAHGVERDAAGAHAVLRDRLARATMAFRGGSFDAAASEARAVLDALRGAPGTPGAARLAWSSYLLLAQVGFGGRDDAATDAALRSAASLDPEATLSTRQFPPDLVTRHERIRAELLAGRDAWVEPRVEVEADAGDVEVNVDGRPAAPVPPGSHFVVVRRPGFDAVATFGPLDGGLALTSGGVRIPKQAPRSRAAADAVCAHAELDWFLVVKRKGDRVGLERYTCGRGFAPASYVSTAELAVGTREALSAGDAFADVSAVARDRWPAPMVVPVEPAMNGATGPADGVDRKPWFRRAWVWALVGTVVVGAVTTGVVLGTRDDGRRVQVDVPSFTAGD